MMLSICMIAYNHEKFISEAIESVLMQKTSFDYELVIGEDCSTDTTRKICLEYQQKYPKKIKLLLPEKNLGMMPNFIATLQSCKGKYIALCEGDDYWTDEYKLQKQVDFLEVNAEYAICCHRVRVLNENNPNEIIYTPLQKSENTIEDLADSNFIATLSSVFRNVLNGGLPSWFSECKVGDYALHLLNAQHGKIKYMEEVMGVYRVHPRGIWSQKKYSDQLLTTVDVCFYLSQFFSKEINNRLLKASGVSVELFYKHSTEQEKEKLRSRVGHYYPLLAYFMEFNLQKEKQITHLQSEYEKQKLVVSSKEYKLGKILLKPLRYFNFFFTPI